MSSRVSGCSVCAAIDSWTMSGSGVSKQCPQCVQNRLSVIFSSVQSGHFLMAAAFTYKYSLLHDCEQHKRIQPEANESRPQATGLLPAEFDHRQNDALTVVNSRRGTACGSPRQSGSLR